MYIYIYIIHTYIQIYATYWPTFRDFIRLIKGLLILVFLSKTKEISQFGHLHKSISNHYENSSEKVTYSVVHI